MSAREYADGLVDTHAELTRLYRVERFRVTNAEVYGLIDADLVASLEASLTRIYRLLEDQAAGIARLNAENLDAKEA